MTRKDYRALAAAFAGAREYQDRAANASAFIHGIEAAIHEVANVLQCDNHRFDRARFLEAAGVEL